MTDFSVKKSSTPREIKFASGRTSEFTKLKTKYIETRSKTDNSDFANSPVVLASELEMLDALRELAKKEKLRDEMGWIEKREGEIRAILDKKLKEEPVSEPYYNPMITPEPPKKGPLSKLYSTPTLPPTVSPTVEPEVEPTVEPEDKHEEAENENQSQFQHLMSLCHKSDGTFDTSVNEMLKILAKNDIKLVNVINILESSKDADGNIRQSYVEAIIQLAKAEIRSSDMISYTDAFTPSEGGDFDLVALSDALSFHSEGIKTKNAIRLAQQLNGKFEDKEQIRKIMMQMYKAEISPETIEKLIDALSVENVVTGQKKVSKKAVSSVLTLKKALFSTRKNETEERRSPINLLGVDVLDIGDKAIIMKDGEIIYVPNPDEEDYKVVKERYEAMVTAMEESLLLDFVSRYKNENSEIDLNYLRVANLLRTSGIVYSQILDMTDSCIISDSDMDVDRVNAIIALKKAGALSDDIDGILSACKKTPEGEYDKSDLETVCAFSSAVIGGKEVCSLLSLTRGNEDLKEFVITASSVLKNKANLIKLVNLTKNSEPNDEENAFEVISDLLYNFYGEGVEPMFEEKFMSNVVEIVALARGKNNVLADDAAGICAIMCENRESAENIKTALKLCMDKSENVDEKLAQILWDMSVHKATFEETQEIISSCVDEDKNIDYERANLIISLFEAGNSKEKVFKKVMK